MLVQLTVRKSRLIRRSYEMDNRAEQTHPAQLSSYKCQIKKSSRSKPSLLTSPVSPVAHVLYREHRPKSLINRPLYKESRSIIAA